MTIKKIISALDDFIDRYENNEITKADYDDARMLNDALYALQDYSDLIDENSEDE